VNFEPVEHTSWTLFEEPYWLNAVAPGEWQALEVKERDKVVGRLPIVQKVRSGVQAVSVPVFTPWLGPWVRRPTETDVDGSDEYEILSAPIKQLPSAQRILIPCAPELTNLMPFQWAKFDLRLGYTHRLDNLQSEEALWSGLRSEVRSRCRKAEKLTVVNRAPSIQSFIEVLEKTFKRQNMDISSSFPVFERMDEVMSRRKQRAIYSAERTPRGGSMRAFTSCSMTGTRFIWLAAATPPCAIAAHMLWRCGMRSKTAVPDPKCSILKGQWCHPLSILFADLAPVRCRGTRQKKRPGRCGCIGPSGASDGRWPSGRRQCEGAQQRNR
jgi:hypothetical protein